VKGLACFPRMQNFMYPSQEHGFLSRAHSIPKRRRSSVAAYCTQPKYRLGGRDRHSNFAKPEDISGTANEENKRSCMSKKEDQCPPHFDFGAARLLPLT
jgi:hypothetical protein